MSTPTAPKQADGASLDAAPALPSSGAAAARPSAGSAPTAISKRPEPKTGLAANPAAAGLGAAVAGAAVAAAGAAWALWPGEEAGASEADEGTTIPPPEDTDDVLGALDASPAPVVGAPAPARMAVADVFDVAPARPVMRPAAAEAAPRVAAPPPPPQAGAGPAPATSMAPPRADVPAASEGEPAPGVGGDVAVANDSEVAAVRAELAERLANWEPPEGADDADVARMHQDLKGLLDRFDVAAGEDLDTAVADLRYEFEGRVRDFSQDLKIDALVDQLADQHAGADPPPAPADAFDDDPTSETADAADPATTDDTAGASDDASDAGTMPEADPTAGTEADVLGRGGDHPAEPAELDGGFPTDPAVGDDAWATQEVDLDLDLDLEADPALDPLDWSPGGGGDSGAYQTGGCWWPGDDAAGSAGTPTNALPSDPVIDQHAPSGAMD